MSRCVIAEDVQFMIPKYLTGNVCCYETVAKYFQSHQLPSFVKSRNIFVANLATNME
jgi:hypothetical protein